MNGKNNGLRFGVYSTRVQYYEEYPKQKLMKLSLLNGR